MFNVEFCYGYYMVYDMQGNFLFSADSAREAKEEMKEYEEFAA